MGADMGGTEIYQPFREIFSMSPIKGHPRQVGQILTQTGCDRTPLFQNHAVVFFFSFFFAGNWVYIPNFGLKIKIFLRFAHPIPKFRTPFFKFLRMGL